jgi:hypothetical protein
VVEMDPDRPWTRIRIRPDPILDALYLIQAVENKIRECAESCSVGNKGFTLPHDSRKLILSVLRMRLRIRMFLGLSDPDPLVGGTDPLPDPSIIK